MPRLVEEQNILRRLQALEWCYNREGPSVPRYIGTANNNRTLLLQPIGKFFGILNSSDIAFTSYDYVLYEICGPINIVY